MNLELLFSHSFDTFKVFNKLDIQQASLANNNSPKSVWQILSHLIIWQDYQINLLCDITTENINEIDTWVADKNISDQSILNDNIEKFEKQIERVKIELTKMKIKQKNFEKKLKIIQDLTVHLSFHLGEIVQLMRQNGHYPMPNEMTAFMTEE
jgi:hypothetical protein